MVYHNHKLIGGERQMRLSILPLEDIQLIQDGSFSAMALCDSFSKKDTFTFIEGEKYIHFIEKNPSITCVLCTKELINKIPKKVSGICISSSPKLDFFLLHNRLCKTSEYNRAPFTTKIGMDCSISPLSHIDTENVIIGNNVVIEEFVSIKAYTKIGNNVMIRAGSRIGCDGFEFKRFKNEILFIEHVGGVVLDDFIEVFSNACICKAIFPWDDTMIGKYSKIDNLVHIGHACKIGKRNLITAGTVFCGSATTDDDVYIGPNATIAKINMADKSKASLGSVVISDVKPSTTMSGNFAVEHLDLLKHTAKLSRGK
jgi:UDP-3-O-[3-hydroxymyristoyl] glucosamine N-acyltransferase